MTQIDELIAKHGTSDMKMFIPMNIFQAMDVLKESKADLFSMPSDLSIPFLSGGMDFFISEARLPRYYHDVTIENPTQAFANILIQHLLTSATNTQLFSMFIELLDNRMIYGLKDSDIVQYFVETQYEANDSSFLQEILFRIDLSSDTQGYIIQYICVNGFSDLLQPAIAAGSNLDAFLTRYEDKNLWLTNQQEDDLSEADYNHDRTYNIYKKFDTLINNADEATLALCKRIHQSIALYAHTQDIIEKHPTNTQDKMRLKI